MAGDTRVKIVQRGKVHKTLIDIAHTSKRLQTVIAQSNFLGLQALSARTRLDKIVTTSREILAKSLENDASLDPGLEVWLATNEPDMCLWTLHDMEKLIPSKSVGRTSWGRVFSVIRSTSASAEANVSEAIKLFDERKGIFYFLLAPEVWNSPKTVHAPLEVSSHIDSKVEQLYCVHSCARGKEKQGPFVPPTKADGIDKDITCKGVVEEQKKSYAKKIDSLLQWLDGLAFNEKYGDVLKMRQPGTCKWLIETNQYNEWKNGRESFLWLQGKPGAGKTVLATSIIETIKQALQDEEHMAFFYCDFRSERTTSAAIVMRSILSQLLRKLRDGAGRDLAQLVDDLVKEKTEDASILKHADRIAPFVSRTARQLGRQPFVVIDALDECQDLENLLHALCKLTKDKEMRLFVTSRPLQIIKDNFRGLLFVSTERMAKEVSADIELHVTKEVEADWRLRNLEEKLKTEICEALQRGADGMFRWVQCQIDTLKKCPTAKDIRNALGNLPDGLEETYERILCGMDPLSPEGKVVMRALIWLVAALRSLCLIEIIDALSIDPKSQRLDRGLAPVHGPALLGVLGSLVVYNEESDVVNLSHFTVKEYLVGSLIQVKLPGHRIDLQLAHAEALRLCMGYIAALIRHPQLPDAANIEAANQQKRVTDTSPDPFPFFNYVFVHGFCHLKHLEPMISPILDDVVALRLDIGKHPTEWAQISKLVRSHISSLKWLTPEHDFLVYIFISALSAPSLHEFLCHEPFKPFERTSPLVYATYLGKIEHARTLLSWGINVHHAGWDVDTPRQLLPLEVAFYGCHSSLFELFLKHWRTPVPLRLFSTLFGAEGWGRRYRPNMIVEILQCEEFAEWAAQGHHKTMLLSTSNLNEILNWGEKDIIAILQRFGQAGCDLSLPESLLPRLQITWHAVSKCRLQVLGFLCSLSATMAIPARVFSGWGVVPKRPQSRIAWHVLRLRQKHHLTSGNPTLVQELVSQGHDLRSIVANGDLEFKLMFGSCMYGSSCWIPDCGLCSVFLKLALCKQRFPVEILVVGRAHADKCTLIEMITCVPDGFPNAAQMDDSPSGSTPKPISYAAFLRDVLLQVWDTPSFEKTLGTEEIKSSISTWIQHISSSQAHSSKTNHGLVIPAPIIQVVWCMASSDMDDPDVWQQFCAVYAECRSRRMLPSLALLNKITSTESTSQLERACKVKLQQFCLPKPTILPRILVGVRDQDPSSHGAKQDCQSLPEVIYRYVRDLQIPKNLSDQSYECRWKTGEVICGNMVSGWVYFLEHFRETHVLGLGNMECCWINCNPLICHEDIVDHIKQEHLGCGKFCRYCGVLFMNREMLDNHLALRECVV